VQSLTLGPVLRVRTWVKPLLRTLSTRMRLLRSCWHLLMRDAEIRRPRKAA